MSGLSIQNLSMRFDLPDGGAVQALQDVSLDLKAGELLSVLGPSGCGKTTLLNIVAGFLAPTDGKMILNGHEINGPDAERGMVFQQGALFQGADGDGAFPSALGPTGLEVQVITPVCPAGLDLQGFLPSKPEGLLQAQAHPHIFIFHQGELVLFQVLGLAGAGYELPVRYAIKVVGAGNHGPLVNLLGPPA